MEVVATAYMWIFVLFFFFLGVAGACGYGKRVYWFLLYSAGYGTPLHSQWSRHLSHASISSAFHWSLQILRCSVAVLLCLWPFLWRVRQDALCFLCNIFKCNVLLYFKTKKMMWGEIIRQVYLVYCFWVEKSWGEGDTLNRFLCQEIHSGLLFKSKKDCFNLNFKSILLAP